MKLSKYKKKRDLKTSLEPAAKLKKNKTSKLIFVIQEHHARRLHYDFRLEAEGVLKSWAVPKEPSMDPTLKRLAIQVEDHPYDYKDFEGTIPAGYGAGTVKIWDRGTYDVEGLSAVESEKKILEGLKKGSLHFCLKGKKLKGVFHLIRLENQKKQEWLLMKKKETPKKETKASPSFDLSHVEKIFWPQEKITKGDLLSYYEQIAPWILPYLKDRPVSLKRFPNGIEGLCFFQKNISKHPDWIETISIEHKTKKTNYLLIQNRESLLYAVNLGTIEFHVFFSRTFALHSPDFLVFDLDPKGASFLKVIQIAQAFHELFEQLNIPNYCKTSGATGLHIAIPLKAKYSYEQAKKLGEIFAHLVQQKLPKISTLERSLSKREGKVYIDYYQNNFSQTLAVPYGVRARPFAPVSTPLKWEEVKKGLDPQRFTIQTIFKRLKEGEDLYAPVLGKGIDLKCVLKKIEKNF